MVEKLSWVITITLSFSYWRGSYLMEPFEGKKEPINQSELEEDEVVDQQALVPLQVRQVEFYGDAITVALVQVGGRTQVYVVLRPLCQYLGLSWSSQLQRLREDDVLAGA